METKLQNIITTNMTAEEIWSTFKTTLTKVLQEQCGMKKIRKGKLKATAWWNDTVKEAVKEKKRLYKIWVKSRRDDYVNYRLARRSCKRLIQTSKEKAWKEYGKKLTEICRRWPGDFYKSVKAMKMRDETFDPATVINDKDVHPLYEESKINDRWKEYFQELLNPTGNQ